jgi:hypothetical protein
MKPDIRIEKYPPHRGRKRVMVDGVHWGTIEMSSHGTHGPCYGFRQEPFHGAAVYWPAEPMKPGERIRPSPRPVEVWGDKTASRRATYAKQPPPAPIDERLLATAREIVEAKLLRHPDEIKREREARIVRARAREEADARERQDTLLARAHKLIAEHAPGLNDRDALAAAIADALDHARSE